MPTLPLGGSASQYGTVEYTLSKNIVAALETVSVHVIVKPKFKGTAITVWFRELPGTDYYGPYTRKMATINSGSTYTTDLVVTFPYSSILPRGKELGFSFQVGNDANGNFGESTDWEYTGFTVLQTRIAPVINNAAITDIHALNPLDYFGAFVQRQSLPRITGNVTLDPLDPTLTAVHTLTLTSGGTTIYSGSNATGIFDPGAISATGTIDWTYTATDSAGNSASQTGNFTVLPYTAPVITTLRAERYNVVLDDHGDPTYPAADDGELVRFTVSADVSSVAGKNAWTLVISYGVVGDEGTDTVIPLSGTDGGADTIRKIEDRTLLTATIPANADYQFAVAVYDYLNVTVKTDYAYKASAIFAIEKHGVSVGMRPTSTLENPKLQSAWPIEALDGITDPDGRAIIAPVDYSTDRVDTGSKWIDGKTIYRRVVTFGAVAKSTAVTVSLGESAIDTVVCLNGAFKNNNGDWFPPAHSSSSAVTVQTMLEIVSAASNPTVRVTAGSGGARTFGYVIVDYTLP